MKSKKKDFPIFKNNKNLIFLDSAASAQKPKFVIQNTSKFIKKFYSNIHRGHYTISQEAEKLYNLSKQKTANFINADFDEIIYTYNSTYAANMIVELLVYNEILKKGDKVLLSITEHHANIVPWQIWQKKIGFEIEFIDITDDFEIDLLDFKQKYDEKTKVVSITHISNVTGTITNLEEIKKIIKDNTIFIVDASQSAPHIPINVKKIGCDFLFFTAHKLMAYTGLGVLYINKKRHKLNPALGGGDMIQKVTTQGFTTTSAPTKFEPGTPNIISAISLLYALEYIEKIGGLKYIQQYEEFLSNYFIQKFSALKSSYPDKIELLGKTNLQNRIGVFSLYFNIGLSTHEIGKKLAEKNICIRTGGHCAHPLANKFNLDTGTARASLYIYNTTKDIDIFFNNLEEILKSYNSTKYNKDSNSICG